MPAILFARSSTFFESQRPPATAEQWRNSARLQPSPPDTREQTCHSAVCNDRPITFHTQPFEFGATELAGLKIFLRETSTPPTASPADMAAGLIGNCLACYAAPNFTDFKLHNTGIVQREYDDPAVGGRPYTWIIRGALHPESGHKNGQRPPRNGATSQHKRSVPIHSHVPRQELR
jgi:hypothetical protein